jgi:hypothetical protein
MTLNNIELDEVKDIIFDKKELIYQKTAKNTD